MTEVQRYLAEEVAEDHADGIITRREAMRRLGLLGVTGAAASALLSGVGAKAAGAASPPAHGRPSRHGRFTQWEPVATADIDFDNPNHDLPLLAAWAPAAEALGGVLVIHENRGLNAHIRSVAGPLGR